MELTTGLTGMGVLAGCMGMVDGEAAAADGALEGLQMLARFCKEFHPLDAELVSVLQKLPVAAAAAGASMGVFQDV